MKFVIEYLLAYEQDVLSSQIKEMVSSNCNSCLQASSWKIQRTSICGGNRKLGFLHHGLDSNYKFNRVFLFQFKEPIHIQARPFPRSQLFSSSLHLSWATLFSTPQYRHLFRRVENKYLHIPYYPGIRICRGISWIFWERRDSFSDIPCGEIDEFVWKNALESYLPKMISQQVGSIPAFKYPGKPSCPKEMKHVLLE